MLSIHAFHSEYFVSQDHSSPEGVQSRLDDIVQRCLPGTLQERMKGWDEQHPGLWFIRRLETQLDIDTAWEDQRIADCWAERIIHSLDRSALEVNGNCLYFADNAEYLARFLIDVADGNAWQQWFYQPFAGLRMLPTSTALRSALEQKPGEGLAALAHLRMDELEKVLSSLNETDARRLLITFGNSVTTSDADNFNSSYQDAFNILWETWHTPRRSLCESAEVILHYVPVSSTCSSTSSATLIRSAAALTRLLRRSKHEPWKMAGESMVQRILAALAGGDLATLYSTVGSQDGEILRPLVNADPEWIWQVGQAMDTHPLNITQGRTVTTDVKREEHTESEKKVWYTPFGGAFLLLPIIDSLPLAEATKHWPECNSVSAEHAVRFLLLTKSLGGERAEMVFNDSLLRDLLLVPPALSLNDITDWQSLISSQGLAAFRRVIASWQTEKSWVKQDSLLLTNLNRSAQVLLFDGLRLMWHSFTTLRRLKKDLASGPTLACEPEEFCQIVRTRIPEMQVHAAAAESGRFDEDLRARLAQIPEDMLYLRFPASFGARRIFNLSLDIAAQSVLRLFAWRLSGFARSGLAYLYLNFLDQTASLEDEPARRLVRLGRPPLALILNMTGQNRQEYCLSWLGDRPFELYPEE